MVSKKKSKKREGKAPEAPATVDAPHCEPIPPAFKLEHGQRLLVDASVEEMVDEMRRRIPAFILSFQGDKSTRFAAHGRWAEVIGLHVMTGNWIAQPTDS
jgi:hypothetical protein